MIEQYSRLGMAVYLKDVKKADLLKRFGNIHYVSKRLKYVYLYIDEKMAEQIIHSLNRMAQVQRIELSQRKKLAFL